MNQIASDPWENFKLKDRPDCTNYHHGIRNLIIHQPGFKQVSKKSQEKWITNWTAFVVTNWTVSELKRFEKWATKEGWFKPKLVDNT